jgi:hypothetical protein
MPQLTRAASMDVRIHSIARRLGMADRTMRTIVKTVRHLIEGHGFPLPKTVRFVKGSRLTGSASVHAGSVWDRDAVDDWFEGDLPPAVAAAEMGRRREGTRAELAARAAELAA